MRRFDIRCNIFVPSLTFSLNTIRKGSTEKTNRTKALRIMRASSKQISCHGLQRRHLDFFEPTDIIFELRVKTTREVPSGRGLRKNLTKTKFSDFFRNQLKLKDLRENTSNAGFLLLFRMMNLSTTLFSKFHQRDNEHRMKTI